MTTDPKGRSSIRRLRAVPKEVGAMNGLTITETMTTPTRPGKQPRPVWEVRGNTMGLEEALRDLGGRKYRGAWSFFEDPTEALAELMDEDRLTFAEQREASAERAEARAECYEGYSQSAAARRDAAQERSRAVVAGIPLGQPILVGHHSEKRHRRDLERSDNAMRKAIDEDRKADHWRSRAAGASSNARPDAERPIGFMQRRLEDAETEQRKASRNLQDIRDREARGAQTSVPYTERIEHMEGVLDEATERADYWRGLIEAKGGVQFSRDSVAKGDVVVYRNGSGFGKVVRVNAKTVSVEDLRLMMGDRGWPGKVPYAEIREVVPAARVAELEAKVSGRGREADPGPDARTQGVLF